MGIMTRYNVEFSGEGIVRAPTIKEAESEEEAARAAFNDWYLHDGWYLYGGSRLGGYEVDITRMNNEHGRDFQGDYVTSVFRGRAGHRVATVRIKTRKERKQEKEQADKQAMKPELDTCLDNVHPCTQCGEDQGFAYILGPVCLKCCRKNHRKAMGRS